MKLEMKLFVYMPSANNNLQILLFDKEVMGCATNFQKQIRLYEVTPVHIHRQGFVLGFIHVEVLP